MKRTILAVAVGLVMVLVGGAAVAAASPVPEPGSVDPRLADQLAGARRGAMVDALVVLRSQADLSRIRETRRSRRLAAVEGALRAKAAASQRGVLGLLARRRAQRLVAGVEPLWIVNEVAVRATPSVIKELAARRDVQAIRPNVTIQAPAPPAAVQGSATVGTPEANVARINAPALWDLGLRGQGVVVANMDTGVDNSHPDLASRWRGGSNSWYDPNGQHSTPADVNGHGTWTMGVMVGGDAGGTSIGVAPDAKWVAVKIFNDRGSTSTTVIHRGFQWLLDPDGNPATADAPNVVNNSWTMSVGGCNLDFEADLANLRAAGILPVFSAGNYGPTAGTVLSPANNPEAFAVGSVDDADVVDPYSSRGPSACAGSVAPELAAPGVGIRTSDLYGGYIEASGTSLAAPHVAGALALLLSAAPGISADRQQAALEAGAVDLGPPGTDPDYGTGRLDVLASYHWLATTPDFTVAVSPSSQTTAAGGSVTYGVTVTGVNGFAGDVSLSLAGLSPSQASWSADPPVVQGGSGTAQLTVSTSASIAPGTYPLTITGSSGATSHSATASLVVPAPPDFAVDVSPASRSVFSGDTASYTVGVSSLNGFTGTVALSLSGLPAAVGDATFTPATVTGAGSSTLTIATSATAPAGTYPLTIAGTSGATTHSVAATLVVSARDFSLTVSPSSVSVLRRQTASYTVTVSSLNGFAGSVSLSLTGLPSGASASWSRNPVTAPGSVTLRVTTTGSTTRGTFTLRVTGTSGALAHQATATLTVR
ncbi:MAG TPA: S8 family serine peptidase [Actinomycetes bacterium]